MTNDMKQEIYDRYEEAVQALNRAEMGGDPEEIEAAGKEWNKAWFAKYIMKTYGHTVEEIPPLGYEIWGEN